MRREVGGVENNFCVEHLLSGHARRLELEGKCIGAISPYTVIRLLENLIVYWTLI